MNERAPISPEHLTQFQNPSTLRGMGPHDTPRNPENSGMRMEKGNPSLTEVQRVAKRFHDLADKHSGNIPTGDILSTYGNLHAAVAKAHLSGDSASVLNAEFTLRQLQHIMQGRNIPLPDEIKEEDLQYIQAAKEGGLHHLSNAKASTTLHQDSVADVIGELNEEELTSPFAKNFATSINKQFGNANARGIEADTIGKRLDDLANAFSEGKINGDEFDALNTYLRQFESVLRQYGQLDRNEALRTGAQSLYGEKKLTPAEKEIMASVDDNDGYADLRELLFNRIFEGPDSSQRKPFEELFEVGRWEWADVKKALFDARARYRREGNKEAADIINQRLSRWTREVGARTTMHNLNYAVLEGVGTQELTNFSRSAGAEYVDRAFKTAGVVAACHAYELALQKIREQNNGWLPPEAVVGTADKPGELDRLAKKYLNAELKLGRVDGIHELRTNEAQVPEPKLDEHGHVEPLGNEDEKFVLENGQRVKSLYDWEKDRALSLARGLNILTARTIEMTVLSNVPEGNSQYADPFAGEIVNGWKPYHGIQRFNIGYELKQVLHIHRYNHRPFKTWSYKENEELEHLEKAAEAETNKDEKRKLEIKHWQLMNGLTGDLLVGDKNPTGNGGPFSRTAWRVAHKQGEYDNPAGALSYMDENDPRVHWTGIGMKIETLRGDVQAGKPDAIKELNIQIEKLKRLNPTSFYLNMYEVKMGVLKDLGNTYDKDMKNPLLSDDLDTLFILQEEANRRGLDWAKNAQEHGRTGAVVETEDGQVMDAKNVQIDFNKIDQLDQVKIFNPDGSVNEAASQAANTNRKERVKKLYDSINTNFDRNREKFVDSLKKDNMPFVFETNTMQYDVYDFTRNASNSFFRRWKDIQQLTQASDEFIKFYREGLGHFKTPADVANAIHKIFMPAAVADQGVAKRFASQLALMCARLYTKDQMARAPIFGYLFNRLGGNQSFAQVCFGRHAMAWGAYELSEFTRIMRNNEMWTEAEQHGMQEKFGGTSGDVAKQYLHDVVVGGAAFIGLQGLREAAKGMAI